MLGGYAAGWNDPLFSTKPFWNILTCLFFFIFDVLVRLWYFNFPVRTMRERCTQKRSQFICVFIWAGKEIPMNTLSWAHLLSVGLQTVRHWTAWDITGWAKRSPRSSCPPPPLPEALVLWGLHNLEGKEHRALGIPAERRALKWKGSRWKQQHAECNLVFQLWCKRRAVECKPS